MDLYQLRTFLAVARALSFTRAAETLHVSPPAVSKSVALLERSLGRRLFTRTRRRVELTRDGELLKSRAEAVYDLLDGIRLDFEGRGPGGPAMLKIGSREMITNYLLPPALRALRALRPQTRFGIYELGPRELASALRKDLVDFGFLYAELPDPALECRKLGAVTSHIYAARASAGRARAQGLRRRARAPVDRSALLPGRPQRAQPGRVPGRPAPPERRLRGRMARDAPPLRARRAGRRGPAGLRGARGMAGEAGPAPSGAPLGPRDFFP